MKAKQFQNEAGRMASQLAERAGITPGYWRQLLTKDFNVPEGKREALADAVEAYGRHLLAIAKDLRQAADLPGTGHRQPEP